LTVESEHQDSRPAAAAAATATAAGQPNRGEHNQHARVSRPFRRQRESRACNACRTRKTKVVREYSLFLYIFLATYKRINTDTPSFNSATPLERGSVPRVCLQASSVR